MSHTHLSRTFWTKQKNGGDKRSCKETRSANNHVRPS